MRSQPNVPRLDACLGFLRLNTTGTMLSEALNSWGASVSENLNPTCGMGFSESEALGVRIV